MLSIFKSATVRFPIAEILHTDMHAHILPGIDDGADNVETSIALIRGLRTLGYKRFIATPHIISDLHPNTKETIESAFHKLKQALLAEQMDVDIDYAAEYMMDEMFEGLMEQGPLLKLAGDYVLVETMFMAEPPNLSTVLFDMQTAGYKPVVAHPERYHFVFNKPAKAERMKDRGALLQINALSLTGYYGKHEKHTAIQLLEAGLVDFIGTDLHHERHLKVLTNFVIDRKVADLLEKTAFKNKSLKTVLNE
ncbi:histidinol phosphatase [Olivibacter sp. LS-1]|uniref:tyrosine-protein phosphatase n=1 Tax=unclassified Olivibacter TaxID=2632301 RepID=UPI0011EB954C|nr:MULTISPECIES: CpsB/CapC family capsule biosynthesis tyrosine phosphatase [unclassified Olivibacter]MDM8177231.1 histidinol phosphatase [Olivibacter sp. 47]QEL00385.1 histidinol phosphatase [Olivibacter sp. LS-1]